MPVEDVFKIDDIKRGQVLAEFGTVHSYTQFESRIYVLIKEKGGRHTSFQQLPLTKLSEWASFCLHTQLLNVTLEVFIRFRSQNIQTVIDLTQLYC